MSLLNSTAEISAGRNGEIADNDGVLSLLGDHDFSELQKRYSSASPYPWICIDNFLNLDFANALAASIQILLRRFTSCLPQMHGSKRFQSSRQFQVCWQTPT